MWERTSEEMGSGQDLLVKRGEAVPLDFEGPIFVCARDDVLDAVLEASSKSRWNDQVLAYFANLKLGEPPVDGKRDTNPEGLTAAYGKWASSVAARLHARGLSGKEGSKANVGKVDMDFSIYACWSLPSWGNCWCCGEGILLGELAPGAAAERGLMILLKDCMLSPELLLTSKNLLQSSNGGMAGSILSEKAIAEERPDPCLLHTKWLEDFKVV